MGTRLSSQLSMPMLEDVSVSLTLVAFLEIFLPVTILQPLRLSVWWGMGLLFIHPTIQLNYEYVGGSYAEQRFS